MCQIIYLPKGKPLDVDKARDSLASNPHGIGMARIDKAKNCVRYTKGTDIAFNEVIAYCAEHKAEDRAIHFRFATHGRKDNQNCHPFVEREAIIMHNGIISGFGNDAKSDTAEFVERILSAMPERWYRQAPLVALVDKAINSDKLLIMAPSGVVLIGEDRGEWIEGLWYSSPHYLRGWYSGYIFEDYDAEHYEEKPDGLWDWYANPAEDVAEDKCLICKGKLVTPHQWDMQLCKKCLP